MGRRGPKPQPTAILKLKGDPHLGRRKGEFDVPAGVPVAPTWLKDDERVVWDELVPLLVQVPGLLTKADALMLSLICEATCDLKDAREEIDSCGTTCYSEKGAAYQHPAVGRKNSAIERLRRLLQEFGLSPAARASVKPVAAEPSKDKKSRFFA